MTRSSLFYSDEYKRIQNEVKEFLNQQEDFLSTRTTGSTRAVGDAVEDILSDQFDRILGDLCADYQSDFARRAMADLAFKDHESFYYLVDVKTHRIETSFNMPNLTSVKRLARLYEDDTNYFSILIVKYSMTENRMIVSDVHFIPIEFLSWECLTIGALGWGQIQIANSNNIIIRESYSRKKWMIELCDALANFYPKEISKITDRLDYFDNVRKFWEAKTE